MHDSKENPEAMDHTPGARIAGHDGDGDGGSPASTSVEALQQEVDRLRENIADLQSALASRDVIGQAKGILMERTGVGADAAFQELVRASQHRNERLALVAAHLVRTRRMPGEDGSTPHPSR